MSREKNELWLRALVDHDGSVDFHVPDDDDDVPRRWRRVGESSTLSVDADEDSTTVVVRLQVRSTQGCTPDWTPVWPSRDGSGDGVSDSLTLSRGTARELRVRLGTAAGTASLDFRVELGTASGIDIVLRAPPIDPPNACDAEPLGLASARAASGPAVVQRARHRGSVLERTSRTG